VLKAVVPAWMPWPSRCWILPLLLQLVVVVVVLLLVLVSAALYRCRHQEGMLTATVKAPRHRPCRHCLRRVWVALPPLAALAAVGVGCGVACRVACLPSSRGCQRR